MSARVLEGGGILGGYSFDPAQPQDRRPQRPLDSTDETSAEQKLRAELEQVNAIYGAIGPSDDRRKCEIAALNAILEHLPEIVPGVKLTVIQDLLWQLEDDIAGNSGSPTRSIRAALLRSYSAAYMSALMDRDGARMSENKANDQVKAETTRWAARIGIDLAASTIKNWRKWRQSRRADPAEVDLYDLFCKQWRVRPRELRTAAHARDWYREISKAALGD